MAGLLGIYDFAPKGPGHLVRHEFDGGPVEGGQVLVVEGRALAPLAVPGLERLGRRWIFHRFGYPLANLVHLLEVDEFT